MADKRGAKTSSTEPTTAAVKPSLCQLGTPGSSGGWMQCRRPATALVRVKDRRKFKFVPACDPCELAYYSRMGRNA